jgi:tRNA(Leu) C34 or U34 (ribose-2'-O)-methylase TrmL
MKQFFLNHKLHIVAPIGFAIDDDDFFWNVENLTKELIIGFVYGESYNASV